MIPLGKSIKTAVIGKPRSPSDPTLFHKLTLIAFFAWVGLGADGISSSCYGPEEAFRTLGQHHFLGIFVALATVVTVFVISASYSQIIELFPFGGGGYLVASKLLSPTWGMVSGCALLVDYVLTIALSIASGTDALLSFFPPEWYAFKVEIAVGVLIILTAMNLRGVKESVLPLVPVFLIFIVTHAFGIIYAISLHAQSISTVIAATSADVSKASSELGFLGMLILILRAYSMGAGTFTGIEAVSNGLPILRDPKVETGKRTMRYIAFSLSFMVLGLMLGYLLFRVAPVANKTFNAILFQHITQGWPGISGPAFLFIVLLSEATILFVAAQTGFLDGPRVMANMALDRWFPAKFAMLSDRLVTQNGILLMGLAGFLLLVLAHGSVRVLVVLYSINVFITFVLSQLSMVKHWIEVRKQEIRWVSRLAVNGVGLVLCAFILIMVVLLKFTEGGYITLVVTGGMITLAILTKRHYKQTGRLLQKLDALKVGAESPSSDIGRAAKQSAKQLPSSPEQKTAILLVNGYNGLGLNTLLTILKNFSGVYKRFVFVQVGVVDAGNYKGISEIKELEKHVESSLAAYASLVEKYGFTAEKVGAIGIDPVDEIMRLAPGLLEKYPDAMFFGGQLVFPSEGTFTHWMHNYIAFSLQRRFYAQGIPFVVLPVRL
jgi:amino acid transporter